VNTALDLDSVPDNLQRIEERGYASGQDLLAKLATLLANLGVSETRLAPS
jgi:hypothetical protein